MSAVVFDDGPLETTEPILDILAAHGRHATFFVVGSRVEGRERVLGRIAEEGHEIGNHGWTHEPLVTLSQLEIADELARTTGRIVALTGRPVTRFRPPFVRWDDDNVIRIARLLGLEPELEPSFGDYKLAPDEIVRESQLRIGEGRPLWLHDGVPATVEALPAILGMLA